MATTFCVYATDSNDWPYAHHLTIDGAHIISVKYFDCNVSICRCVRVPRECCIIRDIIAGTTEYAHYAGMVYEVTLLKMFGNLL